jgi:hypothetical protein
MTAVLTTTDGVISTARDVICDRDSGLFFKSCWIDVLAVIDITEIIKKGENRGEGEEEEKGRKKKRKKRPVLCASS